MSSIRCVQNCLLVIDQDGTESEEKFIFGRWYLVDRVEIINEEYINVVFSDGSIVYGVNRKIFELGRAPVVPAPKVTKEPQLEELADTQSVEKPERPIISEINIIGNEEPDRG